MPVTKSRVLNFNTPTPPRSDTSTITNEVDGIVPLPNDAYAALVGQITAHVPVPVCTGITGDGSDEIVNILPVVEDTFGMFQAALT